MYKQLSKALRKSKDVNIQFELIPYNIHEKSFKTFYRILYGSVLTSIAFLMMQKILLEIKKYCYTIKSFDEIPSMIELEEMKWQARVIA